MQKLFKWAIPVILASLQFVSIASAAEIDKHLIPMNEFSAHINDRFIEVLDIRNGPDGMLLFPMNRVGITLENTAELNTFLEKYKQGATPVLAFDEDGLKLTQLQQVLEKKGIKNYFFLKGGVTGYLRTKTGR